MGCGRPEKEIVGANNAACCPSSVPTVSETFWGENPPGKGINISQNAFSDPYPYLEGAFGPTKKGGGGPSPPPTHNFACSLLFSPSKQVSKNNHGLAMEMKGVIGWKEWSDRTIATSEMHQPSEGHGPAS